MWGIRAIRVGAIMLAVIVCAGCCETCQLRRKDDTKAAPAPEGTDEPTLGVWKRGGGWFKDQPPVTPERITGGIY